MADATATSPAPRTPTEIGGSGRPATIASSARSFSRRYAATTAASSAPVSSIRPSSAARSTSAEETDASGTTIHRSASATAARRAS